MMMMMVLGSSLAPYQFESIELSYQVVEENYQPKTQVYLQTYTKEVLAVEKRHKNII